MKDWPEIVAGCQRGDRKSQNAAYSRVWKHVFPSVFRLVGDRVMAEDIMQEGIMKGFGRMAELRDPQNYPAWQKRICLNAALNRIRSGNPWSRLLPDMEVADEEQDTIMPTAAQVQEQIALLPEGYRVIVLLHLTEGYSHEEIGAQLGISASTSRSQYSRALQKLRNIFSETYAKQL